LVEDNEEDPIREEKQDENAEEFPVKMEMMMVKRTIMGKMLKWILIMLL